MSTILATIASYEAENLLVIMAVIFVAWMIVFGYLVSAGTDKPIWKAASSRQRPILLWSWLSSAGAICMLVGGWGFLTWRLSNGRMLVPTAPETLDGIVYGYVLLAAAVLFVAGWLPRMLLPSYLGSMAPAEPAIEPPDQAVQEDPQADALYQPLYPGMSFAPVNQPPTFRTQRQPQRRDQVAEAEEEDDQQERRRPRRRLIYAGAIAVLVIAVVGTLRTGGGPSGASPFERFAGANLSSIFAGFLSNSFGAAIESPKIISGDIIPDNALDFQLNGTEAREGDFAFDVVRWRPLAKQGNVSAQYKLGVMYANGRGVPRDFVEAYKWLNIAGAQSNEKAIAGRDAVAANMTLAEIETAQKLARDEITAINDEGSFSGEIPERLLNMAPRELVGQAQTLLNNNGYKVGSADGLVGPRTRAAVRQYQRQNDLPETGEITPELVARLEYVAPEKPEPTSKLGPTAILTPSVSTIPTVAVPAKPRPAPNTECDTLAAHPSSRVGSAGIDFARIDSALAIPACEQAVAQYPDELRFQYQLARSLHKAERHSEALTLYSKTGEQGFALAQRSVGFMYANANGVPQDLGQAANWLHRAADRCDSDAQFALGTLYAKGQGVDQSETESRRWYRLAAAQNHPEARDRLREILNSQTAPTATISTIGNDFDAAKFAVAQHTDNLLAGLESEFADAFLAQDYEAVLQTVRPRAEQNDAPAQTLLAYMYSVGLGVAKNSSTAVQWYTKAAELEDPNAQFLLGYMYQRGIGVPQYYAQALQWYRKSATQGIAAARLNLGEMYDGGQGVSYNRDLALAQYFSAAEAGLAGGQHKLAEAYETGDGVPNDINEALNWYQKAAAQNYALSQFKLGEIYSQGKGVTRDRDEAVKWYRLAADQGVPDAQFNLAKMLSAGRGVPRDPAEALRLYTLAADQGHVEGQVNLAFANLKGSGVERDVTAAASWFQKAAAQCNADAQFQLARMYGLGQGVQQASPEEELKFLKLASEQGHASALQVLSVRYAAGQGVEKDPIKALESIQRAALAGHPAAQFKFAEIHANGQETNGEVIVAPDHALAAVWYRKAAAQGHRQSQAKLARLYREGLGVARSNVEAVAWYHLAAEQGDTAAQIGLATAYRLGAGVERDDVEAVRWYRRAADQGDAVAQRELGMRYMRGEGVLQDFVQARVWLGLAATNGDVKATETLNSLAAKMTPNQVSEADRLAKERQSSDS